MNKDTSITINNSDEYMDNNVVIENLEKDSPKKKSYKKRIL